MCAYETINRTPELVGHGQRLVFSASIAVPGSVCGAQVTFAAYFLEVSSNSVTSPNISVENRRFTQHWLL